MAIGSLPISFWGKITPSSIGSPSGRRRTRPGWRGRCAGWQPGRGARSGAARRGRGPFRGRQEDRPGEVVHAQADEAEALDPPLAVRPLLVLVVVVAIALAHLVGEVRDLQEVEH